MENQAAIERIKGKGGPKPKFPGQGNMRGRNVDMPETYWAFVEKMGTGAGASDYIRQLVAEKMAQTILR